MHPTAESLLRCPRCRGALTHESPDGYDCAACRVRYPVRDDVPDFTPDAAKPLDAAP